MQIYIYSICSLCSLYLDPSSSFFGPRTSSLGGVVGEERGKDRRGAALQTADERKKRPKKRIQLSSPDSHLSTLHPVFEFTHSKQDHLYYNNEKSIFCQNTAPVDRGNFFYICYRLDEYKECLKVKYIECPVHPEGYSKRIIIE